jgi:enoyl-[acyl-carrier protein] reductase I
MAGLLEGKRVLIAGVLTEASIGFAAAKVAQQEGAQVVISSFGRALPITRRIAKRLPTEAPIVELDVNDDEHLATLSDRLREHVDGLDGVVHAIAFAPQEALGDGFAEVEWEHVATAIRVSTWSFAALARAVSPLLAERSALVGLDFDASAAWPAYGWMGVAKAGLESCARYLARELGPRGVRVNLVAAGPLRTMAAKSIPGFEQFEDAWDGQSPLGWDVNDVEPAGRACVALLSDWFPATTGEIVHVDGGFHAIGYESPQPVETR